MVLCSLECWRNHNDISGSNEVKIYPFEFLSTFLDTHMNSRFVKSRLILVRTSVNTSRTQWRHSLPYGWIANWWRILFLWSLSQCQYMWVSIMARFCQRNHASDNLLFRTSKMRECVPTTATFHDTKNIHSLYNDSNDSMGHIHAKEIRQMAELNSISRALHLKNRKASWNQWKGGCWLTEFQSVSQDITRKGTKNGPPLAMKIRKFNIILFLLSISSNQATSGKLLSVLCEEGGINN